MTSQKAATNSVGNAGWSAATETRDFLRLQKRILPHRHCWRAEMNGFRTPDDGRVSPFQSDHEQD